MPKVNLDSVEEAASFEMLTTAKGGRNDAIFRLACSLRAKSRPESEILNECLKANQTLCVPPLSMPEVRRCVKSALGYEEGKGGKRADGVQSYHPTGVYAKRGPSSLADLSAMSPEKQLHAYIRSLFEPTDAIAIMRSPKGTIGNDMQVLFAGQLMDLGEGFIVHSDCGWGDDGKDRPIGGPNDGGPLRDRVLKWCDESMGMWCVVNPIDGMGRKDSNVAAYRNTLIESDEMPKGEQLEMLLALFDGRLAAIVDTGNKSLHGIVRVDAGSAEEYARKVSRMHARCEANGLIVDKKCKNPANLTRLAGAMRNGKRQRLVAFWPRKWGEHG
jgi:hypothetical protein